MSTSKRLVEKIHSNIDKDKEIKDLEKALKISNDLNGALTSDNAELSAIIKAYEKGGYVATINNGVVSSLNELPPYHELVQLQPLPLANLLDVIKTPLYQKFPFIELNNGNIEIIELEYLKYKGGI